MNAHCTKCRRQVKQPDHRALLKATEARLAGKIAHWTCKRKLPNGRVCGGILTGVIELVNPFKIKGPVTLFKPKKEIITVD